METTIRPLAPGDVDAVVEFALRAWEPNFRSMEEEFGPELFRRLHPDWRAEQAQVVGDCCRDDGTRMWVVDVGGVPVGYVAVRYQESPPCGVIYMLAVDPSHQQRGTGRQLTQFALDRTRESGYTLATVGTGGDRGHAAARRTYEKSGFVPINVVHYLQILT